MNAWTIRVAERRDVPAIMEIEKVQFPEPWSRAMVIEEIANVETRRYTVAVQASRVIGYLGVMFVLDELHVNTLGTAPGHEGRGVASSLLRDALDVALRRGVRRATLEVAASNARAQALYYRFGFSPVGVRKNYYELTREDALILWAEIVEPDV